VRRRAFHRRTIGGIATQPVYRAIEIHQIVKITATSATSSMIAAKLRASTVICVFLMRG
jgi:hypothetical protein